MRVLMMTQALDPMDPLLAFTIAWVRALAQRVDELGVICLRSASPPLPDNVTVRVAGKRADSRMRRLIAFERHVWELMPRADVAFAHMIPRFAWASKPAATIRRRPTVLWYVHRADSLELRVAAAGSRFVATAVPASFPFATSKLRVLGHGVDPVAFTPGDAAPASPQIVFVGRIMPIKHQATLLRALARLPSNHRHVRATFVGGVPAGQSDSYRRSLVELADTLRLSDRVTFAGPLTPADVSAVCRRATVAVNASPTGLFDKAVLETMMSGLPTIVASPSYDSLLGPHAWLRIESPDDEVGLATALDRAMALSAQQRGELTKDIRARAMAAHGLDAFMDRLVDLLAEAAGRRS